MATIEEAVAANRRQLLRRVESPLVRELIRSYGRVLRRIEQQSLALAEQLAQRQTPPTRSELLRMRRLDALAKQVEDEMRQASTQAADAIRERRRVAIIEGMADARGIGAEVGVRLNAPAVERITAALAPGSPLRALVDELPAQAAEGVRTALIDGVVAGRNPREVARGVSQAMGGQTNRALTIARTETLRAYRGASLETFRANPRIIEGWVWTSARDTRTCAVCWAMHGREFPVNVPFASHPNCRCSPSPLVRNNPPEIETGIAQFAELPQSQQVQILGPAKYRAYKDGALDLNDLVGEARDPRWGDVRYERSLRSVLGQRRAVDFYRSAA